MSEDGQSIALTFLLTGGETAVRALGDLAVPLEEAGSLPSGFTDEDFQRWIQLDVLDYL